VSGEGLVADTASTESARLGGAVVEMLGFPTIFRRSSKQQQEFTKLVLEIERLLSEKGRRPSTCQGAAEEIGRHHLDAGPTLEVWRTVNTAGIREGGAGLAVHRSAVDTLVERLQPHPISEAPNTSIRGRPANVLVTEWLSIPSPEIRDLLVASDRQKGR
jgi:hypothetical protein